MKYLVTGGAGFIGSNLVDALLADGHAVVCLDNFTTGKITNLETASEHPAFTLIEGDIRDKADCHEACREVDHVLHHAAIGSVPQSIEDPATSNDVNVSGFINILVAARDAGVKRVVYASSAATYGDRLALPQSEPDIGEPLSPYAVTKYVNELYAGNFGRIYNMETVGLRYFNVFGRRQDPDGAYASVIPRFVQQFIRHESPVINGDGEFSRDFVYIDNVIQVNLKAATTEQPQAINRVYNVACGERTSLNELAAVLKEALSAFDPAISGVSVQHGPERLGDIAHSQADISRAVSDLGYTPTHDFKTGVAEAARWYFDNLQPATSKHTH